MNLPRPVRPSDNTTAWLSKLLNRTHSNTVNAGENVSVTRTPWGSTVGVSDSISGTNGLRYSRISAYSQSDPDASVIKSFFDSDSSAAWLPTAEYFPGQVVRVLKTYHAGYEKTNGDYDQDKPIYVVPCVAICVSHVPPYLSVQETQDLMSIINSGNIGISLAIGIGNSLRRTNVCYGPLVYEWEPYIINDKYDYTVDYSTLSVKYTQGRFWEVISILPRKMTQCVDGASVNMIVSGITLPSTISGADGGQINGPGLVV